MSAARRPSEIQSTRMGPLACLPVFFQLANRRVLVAGGTSAAAWKVELLLASGATVDIYASAPSDEMLALVDNPPNGTARLHPRCWQPDDLIGAALAIGSFDNDREAQVLAAAARAAGVPVNVIDRPRLCDFSFGAIVNRSPLVIGISTNGAAPVFAQAIRAKLEALLPKGFARWASAAARWRPALMRAGISSGARRLFWRLFTARAMSHPDRPPADSDFTQLLDDVRGLGQAAAAGCVVLVGAGPGDPELRTLRAVRALQSADVILFDDLVSGDILEFARREAKKLLVGKTGHGPSCKQDDINALMVSLANSGKRVVRLKGGDPMIFGRAGEEIDACRAAGIPVEVIPGITAAQGAAATLALPLTYRGLARRVQYVTGHAKNGELPTDIDWQGIADPATTTVVYMPTRTLTVLVERAIAHGLDPQTPAVAIASATRPDQAVIADCIADLPARLSDAPLRGPVLVMIGRVLARLRSCDAAMAKGAELASSIPLRCGRMRNYLNLLQAN